MITADVAVVGAGPAGVAAAITLARAGREVVVVDKATFPRDKCCGDGLTTGALRELEALAFSPNSPDSDPDRATVPSWRVVPSAWVRSPSGRTVEFPLPGSGSYAAVAPRTELDAALVDHARAVGVAVHEGHALTGAEEPDRDRIELTVEGLDPIVARYAIGADGMWSPLRKAVGLSDAGYLGEWHAFRQYATGVTGTAADRLWVWFEADLLPGYAWSFPLPDGRANVGFGILRGDGDRRETGREMGRRWPDLLARPHIREALGPHARFDGTVKAWPIPARVERAMVGAGRVLLVGDAAAVTDPLTGEGIGQALQSGRLAAEAVLAAGAERPDLAQAHYRRAVRHELTVDHRLAVALGRVLRHPLGARAAIRLAGSTAWTRANFGRWLFEDEPRAAALTPTRWHRGFLARPGAYQDTAG